MLPALRSRFRFWMAPVAILGVSAVAVAIILLLKPQVGEPAGAALRAAAWNVDCPGAMESDFKCLQKHYQVLVASNGVGAAIADMKDAYEKSGYVRSNCHQLVHVVGGRRQVRGRGEGI
jgi:hypothetical protein